MNKDIIELETKIAFLEKYISEISDTVYDQQKQIERLNTEYQRLNTKLLALENDPLIDVDDEKPPHY